MTHEESGTLSYASDIKPLFRAVDRDNMIKAFDLWKYEDVVAHEDAILREVAKGSMPCDGAWPEADVERFRTWVSQGSRP